jgi:hypothetical protein
VSDGRPWQHPAERGAEHGHDLIVNPPPVGRRISVLAAIVSIIASIAVASVAIPKGISEYADEPDPTTTTTVPARVKGSAGQSMIMLTSGDTSSSALALGDGWWLAAADLVDPTRTLSLSSSGTATSTASVVGDIGDTGMALLKTAAQDASAQPIDFSALVTPDSLGNLSRYRIYDPSTGRMSPIEPSISLASETDDVPINTPEPIGGIASVIDDNGTVVGIVVRRGHATWLLGRTSIELLKKSVKSR